ncbi:MAG: energy-coupled thiamine transporter ThiT [Oscillospiraceae bacterium]|nr:energy-coupled thiamine transporter ThiT [Oscillospiraceae bacterium]
MKRITTRKLVESAIFIALATVLSLVQIPMPFGGGLTACSMLPLVIISFRYGWKWGAVTAFVYSVVQIILGVSNVAYASSFIMAVGIIFLDYIIAYTVIGLAGIFDKCVKSHRAAVAVGIVVTFCLRFVCHLISGAWIWGEWMPEEFMGMTMTGPWLYSFLYNGWYMLGEIILTLIVAMLIYKPLEKYFRGEDLQKA